VADLVNGFGLTANGGEERMFDRFDLHRWTTGPRR
jgi:hypothetical protein